jgi:hypothetical protein
MAWISVDVEADGPCPGEFSMIQLGAVYVDPEGKLDQTFYGELSPISDKFVQSALDVVGVTRQQTRQYPYPRVTMKQFKKWLHQIAPNGYVAFISDNNGFDWQFVNYYFHRFVGDNIFGHSSTNLGSLYKGMKMHGGKSFKKLRKTKHTHHPVDDAKGNAEALLAMIEMGLKWKL